MKFIAPTLLLLPLIACGGDDAGPSRSALSIEVGDRFEAAAADHRDAFASNDNILRVVPTTGSTEANGAFKAKYEYTNGRTGQMVGDIKAEFDFANNDFSGEVSDIQSRMFATDDDEERLSSGGILNLTGARKLTTQPSADQDGHKYFGTATGFVTMPNPDGTDTTVDNVFTLNAGTELLRADETPLLPDGTFQRTITGARGTVNATDQTLPVGVETFSGQWSGTVDVQ